MAETSPPYQMIADAGHVTVILQPEVRGVDWGELEAFGSAVLRELENHSRPTCLVDLSQLDYMGSAQVALLVRLWKGMQAKEGEMVVVSHQPFVLEVITLAGLNQVWDIVPSVEVGLRKLGRRASSRMPGEERPASGRRGSGRARKLLLVGVVGTLFVVALVVLVQSLTTWVPTPGEMDRRPTTTEDQADNGA